MKVFDKFLDKMNLSSYEDYDDDYDTDEDDYEEKTSSRKNRKSGTDEIFEDRHEEQPAIKQARQKTPAPVSKQVSNKVVSMRKSYGSGMGVHIFRPKNVDEGRSISDTLSAGKAVILNLEGLDISVAQRIIDFTSGVVYSMNGKLENISNYIFVVAPETVEISGDYQENFTNSFNIPSGNDF